ncbi:MAG: LCP family protein [Candidatus Moranbacteria bacterium]|nr:LCP family protein [Candidatus Moranbacteria bacterium]
MENHRQKKRTKIIWRGFVYRLIILSLIGIFSYAGFLLYKVYKLEKTIYVESAKTQSADQSSSSSLAETAKNFISGERLKLKGEERGRINILLLGMGGEGHKGEHLTDTIMVASINPETYETAFLSIPRDLFVKIPGQHASTRINAIFAYGLRNQSAGKSKAVSMIREAVENVTGQPIDYYAMLDFKGFKEIINELGGIRINVEEDIVDHRYPGPNYSYQTFRIDKGSHLLDGETALKYARVRHASGGDFARARRQQKVIAASKRKAFALNNFLNPNRINGLFSSLENHLITNVKLSEIPSFLSLANKINIYNTTNRVLDAWSADSLLSVDHVMMGGIRAFVLRPRTGNYNEIHSLTENIFQLNEIKRQEEEIKKEKAKIKIISNNQTNLQKAVKLLRKMDYQVNTGEIENSRLSCDREIRIYDNSSGKLFTLNDLANKFDTEVQKRSARDEADILLCLPGNDLDFLSSEESQDKYSEEERKSIIDEKGNVIYNQD